MELFPSSQVNEDNLVIVHDETDEESEDELVMLLWKDFTADNPD